MASSRLPLRQVGQRRGMSTRSGMQMGLRDEALPQGRQHSGENDGDPSGAQIAPERMGALAILRSAWEPSSAIRCAWL